MSKTNYALERELKQAQQERDALSNRLILNNRIEVLRHKLKDKELAALRQDLASAQAAQRMAEAERDEAKLEQDAAWDELSTVKSERDRQRQQIADLQQALAGAVTQKDALVLAINSFCEQWCDGSGSYEGPQYDGEGNEIGMENVQCRGCVACDPRIGLLATQAQAAIAQTGEARG